MVAAFVHVPEFALDAGEADRLAEGINAVAACYDMPILDEKTMAWFQLGVVSVSIYGPRVAALAARKKHGPQVVPEDGHLGNR
ncbi:MAG: hypothetical protein ACP5EP_12245 [Acidobacteriaceae bacterium]